MGFDSKNFLVSKYFDLVSTDSYFELVGQLKTRTFSPKDLGISYRELNHWSSQKLLLETNEFGKMRRYNLIEMVWIEIVKELRVYSLSLPIIKRLKDNINTEVPFADVFEMFRNDILETVSATQILDKPDSEISAEEFEKIVGSPDFISEISRIKINYFETVILQVYVLKLNYNLLINAEGLWNVDGEFIHNDLIHEEFYQQYFSVSHISISLGSILSRVFKDYKIEELKLKWRLISVEEEKVLNLIRDKSNIKSITIRFNQESTIDLLEYTETLKISLNDYLKKIVIAGGYEKIEIVTQKGSIVHCERTVKEKF